MNRSPRAQIRPAPNRSPVRRPGPAALVALASLATCAAAAEIRYRTVALTGDPAPGTEPDTVFTVFTTPLNHDIMSPRIDDAGRVAFIALVDGPNVDPAAIEGIWVELDGQLQSLARTGTQAPGLPPGVTFTGIPSTYLPFPPAWGGGAAAFQGFVQGPGIDLLNDQGVWIGAPGAVELLLREDEPAPGLPAGLQVSELGADVTDAGEALILGRLRGSGVGSANDSVAWRTNEGPIELLGREGDPAPLTEPGTVFGDGNIGVAGVFRALVQNAAGDFALYASVMGPATDSFNDELLYVQRDGTLQVLVREGEPAPGAGHNVTFGGNSVSLLLLNLTMNNQGRVAFSLRLGGALPTTSVLYSDHLGVLAPLAMPGQPAPGTDFDFTIFGGIALSDAGRVAFSAALPDDDGDIFTPPPFGVWSDVHGSLAPVALPGDTTTDGAVIRAATIAGVNSAGVIALRTTLESAAFRSGLALRDTDGGIHLVAATNDPFDVSGDGKDVRTIERVVGGGFSESGELAMRLDFTDGSSGHFTARLGEPCLGDLDGDLDVDFDDLVALLSSYGCASDCLGDVDGDGDADFDDLVTLLGVYGQSCE